MKNNEHIELHLEELGKYIPSITADTLSEDVFISKISNGTDLKKLEHPFRFDGYFAYFCINGQFHIEVNLRQYEISRGTLMLYIPGNLVSLTNVKDVEDSRFVVVAITRRLLQNARIDFSKLFDEAILVLANPCIHLAQSEVDICRYYYHLCEELIHYGSPSLQVSIMELGASLFHFLGSLWTERLSKEERPSKSSLRSKVIFDNFMKLVSENHTVKREVSFYADKLNISPKYLSQLIKQTSGQSAPDWISSFVILEAKNYLKYSNLDVKEIAYKLNFSSTPVFFRYFKAHTGLTPLEYRRS